MKIKLLLLSHANHTIVYDRSVDIEEILELNDKNGSCYRNTYSSFYFSPDLSQDMTRE